MAREGVLGDPVSNWTPPPRPVREGITGQYVQIEPINAEAHAALLFRAFEGHDAIWDYMPAGPYASSAAFHRWVSEAAQSDDPLFFALRILETGQVAGFFSLLRIAPEAGSIELGYITLSPALQRTRAATEAMYLMMKWSFDAGYRRFEWKCNAMNMASRRAAQRLGLSYEGIFRQAAVVKGRNRDTAWFAAIDAEWPALDEAFRLWLSPGNFDAQGQQKERLSDLTRLVIAARDPAL